jgi:apolipoprotein N-acyltransferase
MYGRVILSARLFAIPFIFPEYCGFLIIFFLIPLILLQLVPSTATKFAAAGFLWGLVAYGIHFIWLLNLLVKKSQASFYLSFIIYIFIVLYAALTSAVWFLGMRFSSIASTIVYFFLLDRYMFWFLGVGYSFLNPLIPLMQYQKCFVFFLSLCGFVPPQVCFMPENRAIKMCNVEFVYLAPAKNGYQICHQLRTEKKASVFVGPETTLHSPLNKQQHFVGMWCDAAPSGSTLLLGSLREQRISKIKQYQTVYHLKEGLIIASYDKRVRVPFAERVPKWWRWLAWGRELFLKGFYSISRGKGGGFFCLPLKVRPLICSELFEMSRVQICAGESDLLIAFVNDSWFCPYFRKIMALGAVFKAWWLGKPLLYVGHP